MGKKGLIFALSAILLVAVMPVAGQESSGEIQIRFANLDLTAANISFNAMVDSEQLNGGQPWEIEGDAPALSDYFTLPADTSSLGLTISTGSGFSGSGFTTRFTADHRYLVLLVRVTDEDGETDDEHIIIDETALFGGAASTAAAGLGRLVFIHASYTPTVYNLLDAAGNLLFAQFLAADPDNFDFEPPRSEIGITSGNYQVRVADHAGTVLLDSAPISLAADQLTMLIMTDAGGYAIIGSELNTLK